MFIPHQVALEQMKRGEVRPLCLWTSKPMTPFSRGRWDPGFKFLAVNTTPIRGYYLHHLSTRRIIEPRAEGERSQRSPSPPSLWPTTGLTSTDTGAWRRLVDHLFSRSTDCSPPASIRKGGGQPAPKCRARALPASAGMLDHPQGRTGVPSQ